MRIHLSWPAAEAFAELDDTPTSQRLVAALPLTASANTWGEEVSFSTGVEVNLLGRLEDDPRVLATVQPGDTITVEISR